MVDTPFEERGLTAPWTTPAEEATWRAAFLAANPHVGHTVVGQGGDGANLHMYTLGTGPRRILFVAQQHGPELSGRDALFTRVRDWAETTDPDVQDWLTEVTVYAIPTVQPNNQVNRLVPGGYDPNRHHITLTPAENKVIQTVIRDYEPEVVIDLHEGQDFTSQVATAPVTALDGVDAGIRALSEDLHADVRTAVLAGGWTHETYYNGYFFVPQSLLSSASMNNRVALLVETARTFGDDSDVGDRHARQCAVIDAIVTWHRDNAAAVAAAVTTAQANATARTDPFELYENNLPAGITIDPLPLAYLLTEAQHDAIEDNRAILGIQSQEVAGGWAVLLAQPAQSLIVYLMDPDSSTAVVEGVRVWNIDPPPDPPPGAATGYVRIGGQTHEVLAMLYRKGGVTRPLTQASFRPPLI